MTDTKLERMVSVLLRSGVFVSGAVVLIGGICYLSRHASDRVSYAHFYGQPVADRTVRAIFAGVASGQGRSIIQLGILLLIATPVARVILALVGFALERDRTYVVVTAIVLCVLLISLISGAGGA